MLLRPLWVFIVVFGLCSFRAHSLEMNGFDVSKTSVPKAQILRGGPPRDGIPSIDFPKFIPAEKVTYLRDDDVILGLTHQGQARAYPLRILVWHEIVNDHFGDRPIAVTYCPLCGTAMVFASDVDGQRLSFGVSGLLYQSDVLMYDRQTESLWTQIGHTAISGQYQGKKLEWVASQQMTWQAWREQYPDTLVLSLETGYNRNYWADAYRSYTNSEQTMFPVDQHRDELKPKAWVVGVIIDGQAKAYDLTRLPQGQVVEDKIGRTSIRVQYHRDAKRALVTTANGKIVPSVMVYWFAWQAFYPETQFWVPSF